MLIKASLIKGCGIAASDGHLGTVAEVLFDDATWVVRWLVVDTGHWLPGRKVLLPPSALGPIDPTGQAFPVKLTMQQVKDSPSAERDRPVSRQMETDIYDHYGWAPYWASDLYMGGYGYLGGAMAAPSPLEVRHREDDSTHQYDGDPHLRSMEAVTGYHIHATDGEIGHVEDFLMEETDWHIHYIVIDTRNWWPGKQVLISPRSARQIDWTHKRIDLGVDRQTVKDSPPYDAATTVDHVYEDNFRSYYRRVWATDPL